MAGGSGEVEGVAEAGEGVGGQQPVDAGEQAPPGAGAVVLEAVLALEQADERLDASADVAQESALGGILAGGVPAER